ncbi:hypothetical protein ABHI18_003193 [Aspergillus niger]
MKNSVSKDSPSRLPSLDDRNISYESDYLMLLRDAKVATVRSTINAIDISPKQKCAAKRTYQKINVYAHNSTLLEELRFRTTPYECLIITCTKLTR